MHGLAYKQSKKKIVRVNKTAVLRERILLHCKSRRLEPSRLVVVQVEMPLQELVQVEVDLSVGCAVHKEQSHDRL